MAALFLVAVPYALLVTGTSSAEFKTLAESKVSEFLKADVKIGKIRVGFLNRITLSHFEIQPHATTESPYRLEVERIVFRYRARQLLKRDFKIPAAILLKSPRIVLVQSGSPFAFFEGVQMRSSGANQPLFELAGGEIHYQVPAFGSEIQLKDIRASFVPQRHGKIKGLFHAKLQGLLCGDIEAKGEIDPATRERHWKVRLKSLSAMTGLLPEGNLLDAQARFENDHFFLDQLHVGVGQTKVQVSADLETSRFSGHYETPLGTTPFEGRVTFRKGRVVFSQIPFTPKDHTEAFLDFNTAQAGLRLESEGQQLDLKAKAHSQGFDLAYLANHVDFGGMDLVSSGTLTLRPLKAPSSQPFRFQGHFETDYFVWEYVPFEDLSGGFEVNTLGFHNLAASWGKVFKASGEVVSGEEGMQSRVTVRVNDFDLSRVQHFASKPLPRDLGGRLKGQLKIQGALARPLVSGRFTIQDGRVGQIVFDSGVIQFDGIAPYLKLKDSRVLKGRTSLALTGALDLSLKNVFYGVQIRKFDQGVLWNGMEMSLERERENLDWEINSGMTHLPALGMTAGNGTASEQDGARKENYLEWGPRFRF